MKSIEEMDYSEKLTWACGTILLGIGSGDWRSAVGMVVHAIGNEAYQRGKKDGAAEVKQKRKAKS